LIWPPLTELERRNSQEAAAMIRDGLSTDEALAAVSLSARRFDTEASPVEFIPTPAMIKAEMARIASGELVIGADSTRCAKRQAKFQHDAHSDDGEDAYDLAGTIDDDDVDLPIGSDDVLPWLLKAKAELNQPTVRVRPWSVIKAKAWNYFKQKPAFEVAEVEPTSADA
jgi:hypothetical protein